LYNRAHLKATGSVNTKCRRETVFLLGAEAFAGGAIAGSEVLGELAVLLGAWLREDT
jgi:hypothetical protein